MFSQPGCTSGLLAFVPTTGGCVSATNAPPLVEVRTVGIQLTNPGTCPGSASPTGGVSYNQGTVTVCCDL
ncbi:MAG: hypothetical protein JRI68_01985 [Deltaproteobacteria bacterium]|nr:hypothetical protein [Deltaproteobacteria bacterium]